MALVHYSDFFWFPDGTLAVNLPAAVFPRNSNVFAPLYADINGTIPLPNPLNTSGAGVLDFYAEEGQYWVHIDSETFLVDAGLSEEQADLSSGLASGGDLSISSATSVEIQAMVGYVVDVTDQTSVAPTIVKVDQPTRVIALDAGSLARSITWWVVDSAGGVIQQAAPPSPEQRRTHIPIGVSLFDTGLMTLVETQTLPVILAQPVNQMADLMDAIGPLSLSGNLVTPNGVNLSFNKSAGTLFSRASNYIAPGPVLTNNPHVSASPGQTLAVFRRILRTSVIPTPPPVNTIDPANYDNGGVLTPVGGGTNSSTIQRVWLFATSITTAQIAVQYGQTVYPSLNTALAAIGAEVFTPAPVAANGALIGYIVVTRTATNLSDPAQASFVKAGKFPTP
jgi:hypothetical protein